MIKYTRFTLIFCLSTIAGLGTASAQNAIVSVIDFGAFSDGTNAAATTGAFQQAFAAASPAGQVVIPSGYYAINNPFTVSNFDGEVRVQGDAHIVFQSS